jgi:hypothetical protein
MKKLIFLIPAITFFGFIGFANASMTFDPISPQVVDTSIMPTCSVGDTFSEFYTSDGTPSQFAMPCGSSFSNGTPASFSYAECDSEVEGSACNTNYTSLTEAQADAGYISTSTFTFTEALVCTSPASGVIINTNTFNYSCTGLLADLTDICNGEDCNYMQMQCGGSTGGYYTTPVATSTTFSFSSTLSPLVSAGVNCYVGYSDTNAVGGDGMFSSANQYGEGASVSPSSGSYNVQSPVSPPPTGLITLPVNALASLTGTANEIILNIWVIIALAIGVPLAFVIIGKVIELIPVKEEK